MCEKLSVAAGKENLIGVTYYRFTPALVEELRRAVNE
jgi:hypothetical protein